MKHLLFRRPPVFTWREPSEITRKRARLEQTMREQSGLLYRRHVLMPIIFLPVAVVVLYINVQNNIPIQLILFRVLLLIPFYILCLYGDRLFWLIPLKVNVYQDGIWQRGSKDPVLLQFTDIIVHHELLSEGDSQYIILVVLCRYGVCKTFVLESCINVEKLIKANLHRGHQDAVLPHSH